MEQPILRPLDAESDLARICSSNGAYARRDEGTLAEAL